MQLARSRLAVAATSQASQERPPLLGFTHASTNAIRVSRIGKEIKEA
jgi:hypothetical protein